MIPFRYAEASALVPLLHVKPGPTVVRAVGIMAPLLTAEALRWRDTTEVWVDTPMPIKDSRIKMVTKDFVGPVDAVLLSPEIDPEPFIGLLKKGGVIQAATYTSSKLTALRDKLKKLTGFAVPYREYLPETLWLVMGSLGTAPQRVRRPPDGTCRVTERFLPALFSFGKDELPLVFGKDQP